MATALDLATSAPEEPMMSALLAEVERLRRENASLRAASELAYRDCLTGLRNRRYLVERLEEELSRARRFERTVGSVLVVDVDDFKAVNDTHGHAVGDDVLRFVADLLKDTFRAGDVACRLGGDEFVVILPGTDTAGAERGRQRLAVAFEAANAGRALKVHASVGAATWPVDGTDTTTLLHEADLAMYHHKRSRKAQGGGRAHLALVQAPA